MVLSISLAPGQNQGDGNPGASSRVLWVGTQGQLKSQPGIRTPGACQTSELGRQGRSLPARLGWGRMKVGEELGRECAQSSKQ